MYEFKENDVKQRMQKALDALMHNLNSVRTGRASSGFLDNVKVNAYDSWVSIKEVATVTVSGNDTLIVQPFSSDMLASISKGIVDADLGVNPAQDGGTIRVKLPKMTEERRKELVKIVEKDGEDVKIGIRNIRRDFNDDIKNAEKEKEIAKDDAKRYEDAVQKITDTTIKQVEMLVKNKSEDVMKI